MLNPNKIRRHIRRFLCLTSSRKHGGSACELASVYQLHCTVIALRFCFGDFAFFGYEEYRWGKEREVKHRTTVLSCAYTDTLLSMCFVDVQGNASRFKTWVVHVLVCK